MNRRLTRVIPTLAAIMAALAATLLGAPLRAHAQTESRIFIHSASATEGNGGSFNLAFTVDLSPAAGVPVTVDFATANGTAVAPGDYAAAAGTLTFAPTETSKTILVQVNGDTLNEAIETFTVNLANPTNATLFNTAATGTIFNDDPVPEITITNSVIIEGTGGSNAAVFAVSLSTASGQTVTVDYTTSDGTAVAGSDYTARSGQLTFTPGSTVRTISVPITTDNADELNEDYSVTISNPVNAVITDDTGDGLIVDDDGPPTLSIDNVFITEGDTGAQNAVFTIRLLPASGLPVSVDFATSDNTAAAPGDYTAVGPVTINFAPGETLKTVSVPVIGDTLDETSESFFGNLSAPVNATISDNQGVATIFDNDGPQITIDDVTQSEGTGGTTNFVFTLSLSAASPQTVLVFTETSDNTALAPADYAHNFQDVAFAPGVTSQTFTVAVAADSIDEPTESFFVNLYGPLNATIADSQGVGTIIDDDAAPTISIGDANITEGNSGTASAVFTVELSQVSGKLVTVNVATADGTATAPSDYTALLPTTLFFPPGTRTQNVTVAVQGDTTDEDNETFFVNLSAPANTSFGDSQGLGIITDDDLPPTVSINDVSVTEGNSGTVNATLTISLAAVSGKPIEVNYASSDDTATTAPTPPLPVDYNACAGTASFAPGTLTQTISCQVRGDTTDEDNEAFAVDLSVAPAFAGVVTLADGHGVVTILDDDAPPTISINDISVNEADSATNAIFTVSLSAPSGKPVSVQFTSSDGSATAPADYASCAGTLTFSAGTTSRAIICGVVGDLLDENDENFFVNLTAPTNATIADGQGEATIIDNDPLPSISVGDATVTEGDSGTINAVFSISLSAPSGREVRVSYATADGTAIAGSDYTAVATTELVFAPGVSTRNVSVAVAGDLADEFDENFFVNLTAPTNATIADGQGEATINDNDPPPDMTISCPTVAEGDSGTSSLDCTVSLSQASGKPISVNVATADGSATSPADYTSTNVALSFTPGEVSKTVSVPVVGDTIDEIDETFSVNLSGAVNATITTGAATATIDDDDGPAISLGAASVTEGDSGTTAISFAVSLSAPSPQAIAVSYSSSDGSATSPADYSACSGTLTIPANSAAATIGCLVAGDTLNEGDESFTLTLSGPVDATIAVGTAVGTIVDDDPLPSVSIDDLTVGEPTSGSATASFTVSLSAPSGRAVTVDYKTTDGTAVAPGDYAALAPTTLSFAPGTTSMPVVVTIASDAINELTETFTVDLSNPTNASIADGSGLGSIIDSTAQPVLSIADATINEGDSGSTNIDFTVSLSAPSGLPISVQFSSADGTATSPADYAACSGTLSIAAGDSSAVATCQIAGDLLNEPDETFTLGLSAATNAIIGDGVAVGTIRNDDPLPTISINDPSVTEGDSGTTPVVFTVQLSAPSGQAVSVDYQATDGSATSPADYAACAGRLSFAPGVTSRSLSCNVLGDLLDEDAETFSIILSGPVNAAIGTTQGVATIVDNDPPPSISLLCGSLPEPHSGSGAAICTVQLSTASSKEVTVSYTTADGTALAGADYLAASGALVFAPGTTERTFTVVVLADQQSESNETINVRLGSPINGTLAVSNGVITIQEQPGGAPAPFHIFMPLVIR